jgi:serine/threonine protein kinase
MNKIYHPNICLFMGAVTIPGKLMIVTELVAKGNLETLLHDEKINLPLPLRMRMARDAALGVLWLHESTPTFIHRDLKTSNLLVDENMRVKICDFGLSTVKPQRHQMLKDQTTAKGTPLFMAPEVMMFREFNESSDVYSFAIVLWEILTRQEPFSQFRALDEFRQAVCVRHERPIIPPDTLDSLKRLIERCWDKEPARRPSFREIVVALEHIIVEAAIANQRGREFWKRYFLTESTVGWRVFSDALCDWLKVPTRAQCEKGSVPYLNLKCLKAVLAERSNSDGSTGVLPDYVVSMEKFGKMLEYFGSLQEGFLDNIRELLSQKWFHGELDTADAAARLNAQPPGSFLVRFSSTNPGCFTTSQVTADGSIRHQRVSNQPGKGFLFQNVLYPRLAELIAATFNTALACPNYKFLAIFLHGAQPTDTRYG